MRPQSIIIPNLYIHPPSLYSNSRNYQLSLARPRIDIFRTNIAFSGAFLWNNLPLTVRSCHSLSSFKRKLRAHLEVVAKDGLWPHTKTKKNARGEWHRGFRLIVSDCLRPSFYTHAVLPSLPTACASDFVLCWALCLIVYKMSIDCFPINTEGS